MILRSSPDGRAYGRYVPLGNGQLGFLPIVAALFQAIPGIIHAENPTPPSVGVTAPPSNVPLLLAVGLGGLVIGGLGYLLVKA